MPARLSEARANTEDDEQSDDDAYRTTTCGTIGGGAYILANPNPPRRVASYLSCRATASLRPFEAERIEKGVFSSCLQDSRSFVTTTKAGLDGFDVRAVKRRDGAAGVT